MRTTDTNKYQETVVVEIKKIGAHTYKWFHMGATNSIVCYYPSGAKLELYYSQSELDAANVWEGIQ